MGWSCGTAEYIDLKNAFSLNVRSSKIFYLIRANLNSNEIFLHVHYSENYKSKKQSEIQSVYFGQSAFSWFTASPCDRCLDSDKIKTMPIIIISEESDKSHESAKTCVIKVIEYVISEIPYSINTVFVVSDVCASQFRSKFVLKLLITMHPDMHLEPHYNETHQGEGPINGVGTAIKISFFRKVFSREVRILNPKNFGEYVSHISGVHLLYLLTD